MTVHGKAKSWDTSVPEGMSLLSSCMQWVRLYVSGVLVFGIGDCVLGWCLVETASLLTFVAYNKYCGTYYFRHFLDIEGVAAGLPCNRCAHQRCDWPYFKGPQYLSFGVFHRWISSSVASSTSKVQKPCVYQDSLRYSSSSSFTSHHSSCPDDYIIRQLQITHQVMFHFSFPSFIVCK